MRVRDSVAVRGSEKVAERVGPKESDRVGVDTALGVRGREAVRDGVPGWLGVSVPRERVDDGVAARDNDGLRDRDRVVVSGRDGVRNALPDRVAVPPLGVAVCVGARDGVGGGVNVSDAVLPRVVVPDKVADGIADLLRVPPDRDGVPLPLLRVCDRVADGVGKRVRVRGRLDVDVAVRGAVTDGVLVRGLLTEAVTVRGAECEAVPVRRAVADGVAVRGPLDECVRVACCDRDPVNDRSAEYVSDAVPERVAARTAVPVRDKLRERETRVIVRVWGVTKVWDGDEDFVCVRFAAAAMRVTATETTSNTTTRAVRPRLIEGYNRQSLNGTPTSDFSLGRTRLERCMGSQKTIR